MALLELADPFVMSGCGHEPKEDFRYPVISHAELMDCGLSIGLRFLEDGGGTKVVRVSAAKLLALLGTADG